MEADLILRNPVATSGSSTAILDHYRCRPGVADFDVAGNLSESAGYFRFGPDAVCYGRAAGRLSAAVNGDLFDASEHLDGAGPAIVLPFDPDEVVDNLRYERYAGASARRWIETSWVKDLYYRLRPMLPISVRKHLQKYYLRSREGMAFPAWPVDRSADLLMERLLVLAMRKSGADRIPFIWFWPDGQRACAIVTHDVETRGGLDLCGDLMDVDDAFGIDASFQIVPEKRYPVPPEFLEMLRSRGAEINVHGLDHEGNLFEDREAFIESARRINRYGELLGSRGFRSPVLYRNVDWFAELDFSYDMSVPNVARLEPQYGGCCTVMPYFLPGGMLELPLTMTEDYTLFHILEDYSTGLWKRQMDAILEGHGLMSVIVHPDYVMSNRALEVYRSLLEEIAALRSDAGVWAPLAGEVDRWWRQRSEMELVPAGSGWTIDGPGNERARLAWACLDGDGLAYEIDSRG